MGPIDYALELYLIPVPHPQHALSCVLCLIAQAKKAADSESSSESDDDLLKRRKPRALDEVSLFRGLNAYVQFVVRLK